MLATFDSSILNLNVNFFSAVVQAASDSEDIEAARSGIKSALDFGNAVLALLKAQELDWREQVLSGAIAYTPEDEKRVEGLFRVWSQGAERLTAVATRIRDRIGFPSEIAEFLSLLNEADRVAKGDSSFFDPEDEKVWKWFTITSKFRSSPRPIHWTADGRVYEEDGRRFVGPGTNRKYIMKMIEGDKPPYRSFDEVRARAKARRSQA